MTGFLMTLAMVTLWAVNLSMVKRAMADVDPMVVGLVIFTTSAVLFTLLHRHAGWRKADEGPTPPPQRLPWRTILAVGLLNGLANLTGFVGIEMTTLTSATVLARCEILFTLILAILIPGETVRWGSLLFAPLMLGGVALILGIRPDHLRIQNLGDILMLISALGIASNAFVVKRALRRVAAPVVAVGQSWVLAASFMVALPIWARWVELEISAPWWIWGMMILTGLGSCTQILVYYGALRRVPVWEIRLLCLGVPVIAALIAWLWLDTPPTPDELSGMGLIVAGAAGIIWTGRRRNQRRARASV